MSRKGTPTEIQTLLDTLRQMYAQQSLLQEAATEIEIEHAANESERRQLAARIQRTWALLQLQLQSDATGKPMPENADQIGTPATVACDNCNGNGCAYCGGTGLTPNRQAARDGAV